MSAEPAILAVSPASGVAARAASRAGMIALVYLCAGHFFVDFYSNALGVFSPPLAEKLGLSLTQLGFLGGILYFASSVSQPLFGVLFDRWRSPLFATLAPACAGLFISALGLAPNLWVLALLCMMGGLGIASFHPSGSTLAAATSEKNRQQLMAVFISSGTLGLACGPIVFSTLFERWGIAAGMWAAIPGVVATVLLMIAMPAGREAARLPGTKTAGFNLQALAPVWKPLTILYFCVFLRSMIQIAFSSFLPMYLQRERGMSLTDASRILSLYLIAGALGGFAGGNLAHRFGGKLVIQISFLGCLPLLALFYLTTGPLSVAGLVLGGLVLLFTIPVNVVMGQQLAPAQAGTVSALMMGFSWGMAGLVTIPLAGWIGDHYSLGTAFLWFLLAPVVGFVLTLKLKMR